MQTGYNGASALILIYRKKKLPNNNINYLQKLSNQNHDYTKKKSSQLFEIAIKQNLKEPTVFDENLD